jgi:4-aminobutyrate--pyruvate transaminase
MNARYDRLALADREHMVHGYTNLTRHRTSGAKMIVRGDGVRVFDAEGRDYIEAAAGMWCAALGFNDAELVEAATEQLQRLPYYHTLASKSVDVAVELAERLAAISPIPNARVYFALSGSEGNDFLVKFLWYLNNARGRPEKKKVISRINGYHGATVVATSLTGIERNRRLFDADSPRFVHVSDINYFRQHRDGETEQTFAARLADELEQEILRQGPDTVMAFMAEPIPASAGVLLPPADYYARVQAVLRKYDVMFLADEVVNGFGRTGEMFGCQTCGVQPDAMVLGKGLTGGYLPLAAIVVSDEIYQGLEQGSDTVGAFVHGATYSGYPAGCAVGLKVLDIIESRGLVARSRELGAVLIERLEALKAYSVVGEVRGAGLMAAVEFTADRATRRGFEPSGSFAARVQAAAERCGVIARAAPAGDTIAFSPPLSITREEILEAVDRFEQGIRIAIQEGDAA